MTNLDNNNRSLTTNGSWDTQETKNPPQRPFLMTREQQEEEARSLVAEVCRRRMVSLEAICSRSKLPYYVEARSEAIMAVARRFPHWSAMRIGKLFGKTEAGMRYYLMKDESGRWVAADDRRKKKRLWMQEKRSIERERSRAEISRRNLELEAEVERLRAAIEQLPHGCNCPGDCERTDHRDRDDACRIHDVRTALAKGGGND